MKETSGQEYEAGRLQRMLEEVTAADDRAAGASLDDCDAAALREAWLAFGRLLDAANRASPAPAKPLRAKRRSWAGRHLATIAATAAALCAVICLGWRLTRDRQPIGRIGPVVESDGKQVSPRATLNVPRQEIVSHEPATSQKTSTIAKQAASSKQAANNQATWDEAIDTEIASVSQQIIAVRQTWQHRADDVDMVQYGIDKVSTGMTNDAL